jgi:hypothetical protein
MTLTAARVASAIFSRIDFPATACENNAAQITGLTSDRIVTVP